MATPIGAGNPLGFTLTPNLTSAVNPASSATPATNLLSLAGDSFQFNSLLTPVAPSTPGIFDFPQLLQSVQQMIDSILNTPAPTPQPTAEQPAAETPAAPAAPAPQNEKQKKNIEQQIARQEELLKTADPAKRKKLQNKIKRLENRAENLQLENRVNNLVPGTDEASTQIKADLAALAKAKPGSEEAKALEEKIKAAGAEDPKIAQALNVVQRQQLNASQNDLLKQQAKAKQGSEEYRQLNAQVKELGTQGNNLRLANKQEALLSSGKIENADQVRAQLDQLATLKPGSQEAIDLKNQIIESAGDTPEIRKLLNLGDRQNANDQLGAFYDKLSTLDPTSRKAQNLREKINVAQNTKTGMNLDGRIDELSAGLPEEAQAKLDRLNTLDPTSKEAKDLRKEIATEIKGLEGGRELLNALKQRQLNITEGQLVSAQSDATGAERRANDLKIQSINAKQNRTALSGELDQLVDPANAENKALRADLAQLSKLDPNSAAAKELRAKIKKENKDNPALTQILNTTSRMGANADIARETARLAKLDPNSAEARKLEEKLAADRQNKANLAAKAKRNELQDQMDPATPAPEPEPTPEPEPEPTPEPEPEPTPEPLPYNFYANDLLTQLLAGYSS